MKLLNIKNLRSLLLIGAMVVCNNGYAQQFDNVNVGQMWSGAYNNGTKAAIRVFTSAGSFTGTNTTCDRTDAFIISTGPIGQNVPANVNFDIQFSMLLAAQQSGSPISVWLAGCSDDGKFPLATRVTTFD